MLSRDEERGLSGPLPAIFKGTAFRFQRNQLTSIPRWFSRSHRLSHLWFAKELAIRKISFMALFWFLPRVIDSQCHLIAWKRSSFTTLIALLGKVLTKYSHMGKIQLPSGFCLTGTQSCSFIYVSPMTALELQEQTCVVTPNTIWSSKPKIFTAWSFREKFVNLHLG